MTIALQKSTSETRTRLQKRKNETKLPTIAVTPEQFNSLIEAQEIHLSCQGSASYEKLTSTWTISNQDKIIMNGSQTTYHSRHCSQIKAAALACLAGIQVIEDIFRKYHLTIWSNKLTIWTNCSKLYSLLNQRNAFTSTRLNINDENEIMATIQTAMKMFYRIEIAKITELQDATNE